ncbi:F-box domain-containing protein [Mycena sanguinolenta]|uniref:F-box domain-containing protein n=1 Tax=Mycena sanguinolenta TaxID=230812 RepID=A0A8H6XBP2_9AGAR|nr:F-box domain-containing protein [Mycena sanguinolenta]
MFYSRYVKISTQISPSFSLLRDGKLLTLLYRLLVISPPLDILYLSRTTKNFRSILMHKSAISIWKASLSQIHGLPECPKDMSPPAWVNLVYSPHCHNCIENKVLKVDWLLRIRLCESCLKSATPKLLRGDQHLKSANKLDKIVLQCVPFSDGPFHKGKYCLVEEERKFLKDLEAAEDKTTFVSTRKKELAARQEHAKLFKGWMETQTQERWDELAAIRSKRKTEIFGKLEELGFIEELEYLEDLADTPGDLIRPELCLFSDHPDVKASKPLTQRSWKNMEPRLLEYMEKVKAHRLAAERLALVRKREKIAVSAWIRFRTQFPTERLMPSGTEILSWDQIKDIIKLPSSVTTTERDESLTKDTEATGPDAEAESSPKPTVISPALFTRVFESLSCRISRWEEGHIEELTNQAAIGSSSTWWRYRSSSDNMETLQLAVCVFSCEDKHSTHHAFPHYHNVYPVMWYPEFLHHPCNTTGKYIGNEDVPQNPLYASPKPTQWCIRKSWSSDSIFFDGKASRAAKGVLEACGLDPNVVTTKDMDDMDPRFICLKCSYGAKCDGQRPRKVMGWRKAVQHCMLVHWGDQAVTWQRITAKSAAEARLLSAARGIGSNIWRCAHCRDSSLERDGKKTEDLVKDHLKDSHYITDGVNGVDYYKAVDYPPPATASVQMTPEEVV